MDVQRPADWLVFSTALLTLTKATCSFVLHLMPWWTTVCLSACHLTPTDECWLAGWLRRLVNDLDIELAS